MKLTNNDDCTISLNGVQIADTADVPALWTERRNLAKDITDAYNEHAALVAVAEAAEKHRLAKLSYLKRESSNQLADETGFAEDVLNQALTALAAVRAGSEVAK